MPFILLVAGPNGAGKTTFSGRLLSLKPEAVFVNADEIARELPTELPLGVRSIRAGRIVLARLDALLAARVDIILETKLAGRTYLAAVPHRRQLGYDVDLYHSGTGGPRSPPRSSCSGASCGRARSRWRMLTPP